MDKNMSSHAGILVTHRICTPYRQINTSQNKYDPGLNVTNVTNKILYYIL